MALSVFGAYRRPVNRLYFFKKISCLTRGALQLRERFLLVFAGLRCMAEILVSELCDEAPPGLDFVN
jgi:hypothetical protein